MLTVMTLPPAPCLPASASAPRCAGRGAPGASGSSPARPRCIASGFTRTSVLSKSIPHLLPVIRRPGRCPIRPPAICLSVFHSLAIPRRGCGPIAGSRRYNGTSPSVESISPRCSRSHPGLATAGTRGWCPRPQARPGTPSRRTTPHRARRNLRRRASTRQGTARVTSAWARIAPSAGLHLRARTKPTPVPPAPRHPRPQLAPPGPQPRSKRPPPAGRTPTTGMPSANASPFAVLTPTLNPALRPRPMHTNTAAVSAFVRPVVPGAAPARQATNRANGSASRATSPPPAGVPASVNATPATSPAVSIDSSASATASVIAPALPNPPGPLRASRSALQRRQR